MAIEYFSQSHRRCTLAVNLSLNAIEKVAMFFFLSDFFSPSQKGATPMVFYSRQVLADIAFYTPPANQIHIPDALNCLTEPHFCFHNSRLRVSVANVFSHSLVINQKPTMKGLSSLITIVSNNRQPRSAIAPDVFLSLGDLVN
jgi:hypothetical protein